MQADRPFLRDFESLGQFHDFWSSILLSAPDKFHLSFLDTPIDQRQALLDSFETMRIGFAFVRRKVKDERLLRVLEELIQMSFEYYSSGDRKRGIQALQECEGLIWPSHSIRLKLAADAEQRAFGEIDLFRDIKPSRFEGEGTAADLGKGQRILFKHANHFAQNHILSQSEFKPAFHILRSSGEVKELKLSSQKKTLAEIVRLAEAGEISAYVRTEYVFLGLLIHDIEEREMPRVSARAKVKNHRVETFRYFLDDPTIFSLGGSDV